LQGQGAFNPYGNTKATEESAGMALSKGKVSIGGGDANAHREQIAHAVEACLGGIAPARLSSSRPFTHVAVGIGTVLTKVGVAAASSGCSLCRSG